MRTWRYSHLIFPSRLYILSAPSAYGMSIPHIPFVVFYLVLFKYLYTLLFKNFLGVMNMLIGYICAYTIDIAKGSPKMQHIRPDSRNFCTPILLTWSKKKNATSIPPWVWWGWYFWTNDTKCARDPCIPSTLIYCKLHQCKREARIL